MKHYLTILSTLLLSASFHSCTKADAGNAEAPFDAYWSVENLEPDSTGRHYRQTIRLTGDVRGLSRLAFNQFARAMELADPADTLVEIVPGYYAVGSPRFASAAENDTLYIEITTRGSFHNICYSPDGFHAVMADGSVLPVSLERADITASPKGYAAGTVDMMPYGEAVYARNAELGTGKAGYYDVIPSFKSVQHLGGSSVVALDNIVFEEPAAEFDNPERYTISVGDGKMTVTAAKRMWPRLAMRIKHLFGTGEKEMASAMIEDYPSLEYRGLMVDVSRNFMPAAEVHRVLDLMALYGMNVFHFHLTDDEAWRLEVKSLPELIEVGSRRGYTPGTDGTFLPQIFAGDGNPLTEGGTANGYISQDEYVAIIKHADSLGIAVIPEIESPGHGRAAIEAMKLRARRTGDDSWLLSEAADTSRYTSAQAFHDNVMNPALPGSYKLMSMVADEIAGMHRRAGVELPAIHIGGDEVPRNAWGGSPAVKEMMEREGLKSEKEVHAYFVRRVADDFAKKGIKISGWQEIALRHSDEYNEAVRPQVYSVNCWSTLPSQGQGGVVQAIAESGYPVILSNVNHYYLDMCYSRHPYERGLTWGGTVDEFDALGGYPARLCPFHGANLKGVQGQVFGETLRSAEGLETMLLPKMLGLAERAWNPDSTYSDDIFHAAILNEIPKWEAGGYAYHVRQPGITLEEGRYVKFNSPYPDAVIRVTFDGTEPTEAHEPVAQDARIDLKAMSSAPAAVRARLWLNGRPSPVTILNLE